MATVSLPISSRNGRSAVHQPTRADLVRYLALEQRRLDLNRKARAIEAEADQLAERFTAHVRRETRGKRSKAVTCCGFLLSMVAGQVRPAWKAEFIERLGESAAQEVIKHTQAPLVLSVEPA